MALPARRALPEAYRNALAHPGTTIVLALVSAAMVMTTMLTAGRSAAAERDVMASVEAAKPRLIRVTVTEPSLGIRKSGLDTLDQMSGVEWILALGPARDTRSAATGVRANVAARDLLTDLPDEVTITHGRLPGPGEAVLGAAPQQRLQLLQPAGAIDNGTTTIAIVGAFTSTGAIDDLERLILTQQPPGTTSYSTLVYVLAKQATDVPPVIDQIRALSGVEPDLLTIDTSPELIELQQVLSGQLGALARQMALGAMLVGLVLVALTMTLALNTRRRDYGRRRALGATRSALLALTILEAAAAVTAGALIGIIAGIATATTLTGTTPPPTFVAAAGLLTVITGTTAAIPPAWLAAIRDPMLILRVP